jgi:ribose 5-phosphate isomerase A
MVSQAMVASEQDQWKRAAAEAAAKRVENGMVVGLGTGTTAAFVVAALGRRIAEEKLRITGIPTSDRTAEQARSLGIPLATLGEHSEIDLTIDGADEVERRTLHLIKGRGGALLREKIVAAASKRMIVVADETKIVARLGSLVAVPVEVAPFGWQATERKLVKLGAHPKLRLAANTNPYITDGGHYIIDCAFGPMAKPQEVANQLDHVVGVMEHGLFLGFASQVFIGGKAGVQILPLAPKARAHSHRKKRATKA